MRARPLGVVGLCLGVVTALVAGVGAAPAGAVATDQSYWVPVAKQVVVRGHGFGHGHGMSQYGAQGAALEGLDYRRIIDFYYPGTSWAQVKGSVRVLITGDTTSDVVVSPATGLSVRDLGNGTTYQLPDIDGVKRWRINVGPDGSSVVGYLTGTWHRWSPGVATALAGDGEFFAQEPLTLWTPAGPRIYRGALRAASPTPGSRDRDTVNVLPMDAYLKGVIPREMPASWDPEAVKAQAIAARTYAAWSRAQNPSRYYQICDTTSCQVYGGLQDEDSRSNAAVDATARQILTYDGKPAFTQFSSSSGGWTSAGAVPYLPAKADPYDGFAGNAMHAWSTTIDTGRLERAYPAIGSLLRIDVVSRDGHGEWEGRVWSVRLHGTEADRTISGDSFRWMYGLRSNWFTIDPTPIMARWSGIGGAKSVVGPVRSAEVVAGAGSVQRFAHGRIYYSKTTGARELYGPILHAYTALGGPGSRLGFPTTGIKGTLDGFRARFQRGVVYTHPDTGAVPVMGTAITSRYLAAGGVRSALGWPTHTNSKTAHGERVGFEHGYITYSTETHRTALHVTR